MKLIDTHSHLYEPQFDEDRDEAVTRAQQAGVERLLLPAIDSESHQRMLDMAVRYPELCLPMMGLHPTSVNDNPKFREELSVARHYLSNPPEGVKFCAVGEIGLDLYWSKEFFAQQLEAFTTQCRWAMELDLPVAIHTRSAWAEMEKAVGELQEEAKSKGLRLRGVFHAFSEDVECYERLRALGDFKFGIGGVVTFKKSIVAQTVKQMALRDILLETDCPYLTPAPFRGKRNESGYISYICAKVAELKGISAEEVAAETSRNATELFCL